MIEVSVIIPVYNAEKYLQQCMDSVRNQTLQEIEIICVDDGSTDKSPEILEAYAKQDSRLRIVRKENGGPGAARNFALPLAVGKYVSFLDADDWFEPDFLEKMSEKADSADADICICETQRFDNDSGEELPSEWMLKKHLVPATVFSPEDVAEHLFGFTYGMVWDKLYRREFILNEGLSFPEMRNSEDTAFAYKSLLASKRIILLPEKMVHYRVNMKSSVSNSVIKQPEAPYEAFRLVMEYLEGRENKELFEKSFLNWAMEYLVWHVTNMPDAAIRRKNFEMLRNKWLPALHLEDKGYAYYQDKIAYIKFLALKYLPYWLFNSIVTSYKNSKKKQAISIKG